MAAAQQERLAVDTWVAAAQQERLAVDVGVAAALEERLSVDARVAAAQQQRVAVNQRVAVDTRVAAARQERLAMGLGAAARQERLAMCRSVALAAGVASIIEEDAALCWRPDLERLSADASWLESFCGWEPVLAWSSKVLLGWDPVTPMLVGREPVTPSCVGRNPLTRLMDLGFALGVDLSVEVDGSGSSTTLNALPHEDGRQSSK